MTERLNGGVGHDVIAVLGFADDRTRGGLALGMSRTFARGICPAEGVSDEDWVGELGNQVLGRLRNQLLRYGLDLGMGTPVVLSGVGIAVAPPRNDEPLHMCFGQGDHNLGLFLEARFQDGFEFGQPQEEPVAFDEGSMMMF
ncbi:MAG: chemotaxis protein CheX [Polyangiales bacterium]